MVKMNTKKKQNREIIKGTKKREGKRNIEQRKNKTKELKKKNLVRFV